MDLADIRGDLYVMIGRIGGISNNALKILADNVAVGYLALKRFKPANTDFTNINARFDFVGSRFIHRYVNLSDVGRDFNLIRNTQIHADIADINIDLDLPGVLQLRVKVTDADRDFGYLRAREFGVKITDLESKLEVRTFGHFDR